MDPATTHAISLKEQLQDLFYSRAELIAGQSTPLVNRLRAHAMQQFEKSGFPGPRQEGWRFSDIYNLFAAEYFFDFRNQSRSMDIEKIFTCEVNDLDTFSVTILNGWYVYKQAPLTRLPDGTIIGSLARAMEIYPELIDQYLGRTPALDDVPMTWLNTAFMQDGLFIYVPDNIRVEKPVQLINIVDSENPVFLQPRHLVIAGKGASITLVHCDHSLTHNRSLTNTVLEVYAEENAVVDHYKVQNKGRNSGLITSSYFHQKNGSRVYSNIITLNGGFTRNMVYATLSQPNCQSEHRGLYLADRVQQVDNQVFVDHAAPDCTSEQLYKGILDDQARAAFSGKVLVRKDAQRTAAYQNNKNLLLTDDARVNAQPFLEIYADDVKCSHGATVGQLDPSAMFYLRSRGLCERTARQLMMYAFAMEVVQKITIHPLRKRLDNMVDKRLKGELSICDQCVIHCNSREPATFNIDPSKL